MSKKITSAKIARDIRALFISQPSFLTRLASHEEPDSSVLPPSKADFRHMVETGHYGDEQGYRILYVTYWRTTSITSALMASPSLLGQSYLPDAQVKRMASYILRQYGYATETHEDVKYQSK